LATTEVAGDGGGGAELPIRAVLDSAFRAPDLEIAGPQYRYHMITRTVAAPRVLVKFPSGTAAFTTGFHDAKTGKTTFEYSNASVVPRNG
jgi:hypothetical protein